jgi:hypothetical protein
MDESISKNIEDYLRNKKLLVYGGTAFDKQLPISHKIYEGVPNDWDCYSFQPQLEGIYIADHFKNLGYTDVLFRAGRFQSIFHLVINGVFRLDFKYLEKNMFNIIWKQRVTIEGVNYVPMNMLRMAFYYELSRPKDDPERWTKIQHRLNILNKLFPLKQHQSEIPSEKLSESFKEELIKYIIKSGLVVMGISSSNYYLSPHSRFNLTLPIDILTDDINKTLKEILEITQFKVQTKKFSADVFKSITELYHNQKLIIRIFQTTSCHSFHTLSSGIRIASLPTLLHFYIANSLFEDSERFLYIAQLLIDKINEGKIRIKTFLPSDCIGTPYSGQLQYERKGKLKEEIKDKFSKEYLDEFFYYNPNQVPYAMKIKLINKLKEYY